MNRIFSFIIVIIFSFISASSSFAICTKKRDHTKIADFGKRAMPLAALGVSLVKTDWWGAAGSQVLVHGLYALNNELEGKIGKKRPCGCDGAFPSGHMIVYAASSSYLHYRYGWQYGLPAYVATVVFAYDRVDNKAHGWDDMIGTFAIVNILTYFITPKFTPDVEYVPSSWIRQEDKKNKQSEAYYINEFHMKDTKPEYLPLAYANKDTYLLGFSMRF